MIELRCKHCDRYLGEAEMLVGEIICSNTSCKGGNQYKIITNESLVAYTFTTEERKPKNKKEQGDDLQQ